MLDENGKVSSIHRERQVRTDRLDVIRPYRVIRLDPSPTQFIAAAFGLTQRDMRILDPSLSESFPSAILCRDNCLIVSLEHIK